MLSTFHLLGDPLLNDQATAQLALHMLDNIIPKLGAFDLRSSCHQSREIISDTLGSDRAVQAFEN